MSDDGDQGQPQLGPVLHVRGAEVRVGTCSWTDKTLVKDTTWYPKKTMSAADRLGFYAARFPVVEADSTYYRPPSTELTRGWAERSPDGFRMDVKAFGLMTGHPAKPETLWPDIREQLDPEAAEKRNVYAHHLPDDAVDEMWRRFAEALRPLLELGKLGGVLLQYPPWFTPKRANRDELARSRERLGDVPAHVELRSPRWFGDDDLDRTIGLLADHDLALVAVDAPAKSGLPRVAASTADIAVVRFHGRNDDTWSARTSTAAERFKYLYDRRELRPWVKRVQELAEESREVHVLMNNCYEDYGVRNAADMVDMLTDVAD
ncbi:MAG TPA: DUF72 domain-containing protein [Acidimicrobiales bacterium]|nr:DUF72 domain-containing protein [Acidimicrobiales bacterium]